MTITAVGKRSPWCFLIEIPAQKCDSYYFLPGFHWRPDQIPPENCLPWLSCETPGICHHTLDFPQGGKGFLRVRKDFKAFFLKGWLLKHRPPPHPLPPQQVRICLWLWDTLLKANFQLSLKPSDSTHSPSLSGDLMPLIRQRLLFPWGGGGGGGVRGWGGGNLVWCWLSGDFAHLCPSLKLNTHQRHLQTRLGMNLEPPSSSLLWAKSLFNQVGGCGRKEQNHLNVDDNSPWLHLYLWEIIILLSDTYSKSEDCHLLLLLLVYSSSLYMAFHHQQNLRFHWHIGYKFILEKIRLLFWHGYIICEYIQLSSVLI